MSFGVGDRTMGGLRRDLGYGRPFFRLGARDKGCPYGIEGAFWASANALCIDGYCR